MAATKTFHQSGLFHISNVHLIPFKIVTFYAHCANPIPQFFFPPKKSNHIHFWVVLATPMAIWGGSTSPMAFIVVQPKDADPPHLTKVIAMI